MHTIISGSRTAADSPGAPALQSQERRAEFGRGTQEDKFVVTEVVILAPFYFMCYVFCLLYHRAWVRHSLPLMQLFTCVWYRITL